MLLNEDLGLLMVNLIYNNLQHNYNMSRPLKQQLLIKGQWRVNVMHAGIELCSSCNVYLFHWQPVHRAIHMENGLDLYNFFSYGFHVDMNSWNHVNSSCEIYIYFCLTYMHCLWYYPIGNMWIQC